MLISTTLIVPFAILLSAAAAAKNCTHDPLNYLTHPFAYLTAHPFLTAEIDGLCKDIRHFEDLISNLNFTKISENHPNLDLNVTEINTIVANVTAELSLLEGNATLVILCKRARDVEDSCWPLVYDVWKVNRPECRKAPLANETAVAKKNKTLVALCDVFVDDCNRNKTVTDAALEASDVNATSISSASSTAYGSKSTSTSTSGATKVRSLANGLFVSVVVVAIGMLVVD